MLKVQPEDSLAHGWKPLEVFGLWAVLDCEVSQLGHQRERLGSNWLELEQTDYVTECSCGSSPSRISVVWWLQSSDLPDCGRAPKLARLF